MEEAIRMALGVYITSLDLPAVHWNNVNQDVQTETYIKASILPAGADYMGLCDGAAKHTWILQLSIYIKEGIGEIPAAQLADKLRGFLPFNTSLSSGGYTFKTERKGEIMPSVHSGNGWLFIPCQFRLSIFQ